MIPRRVFPHPSARLRNAGGLVGLLLFVEATVFTCTRDVGGLYDVGTGWAEVLIASKYLLTCGTVVGVGLVIFGRDVFRRAAREFGAAPKKTWPLHAAAHLAALAIFFVATEVLFTPPVPPPSIAIAWLVTWLAAGLVAVGALLPFILAPAGWRYLLREGGATFLVGAGIGLVAWWAGQRTAEDLCGPLTAPTLRAAQALLALVGPEGGPIVTGSIIGTDSFVVHVGIGCAGFEGVGLMWIFLSAYAWLAPRRKRLPLVLVLLSVGTVAAWSANVLRIVALILVGHHVSSDLAIGAFHTRMGWILFCGIALGLVALAERSSLFRRDPHDPRPVRAPATLAFLAPFFVVLVARLVGGAVLPDPIYVYPLVVVVGGWALLRYRREFGCLRTEWSWASVGVGVAVFVVWSAMSPGEVGAAGSAWGAVGEGPIASPTITALFLAQVAGTVLIVPLVEELAFRGYLIRRFVSSRIERVPVGTFTLYSFLLSSLFFGLAHEQWLAGTVAGLAYALVLYRRRNLFHAVLAHGTTNLLLVVRTIVG